VDALKDFDFLLVLFFVVPGFISMRVYALLRPTDAAPLKENVYEAVTFSVINYVLMEWTVPLARDYAGTSGGTVPRLLLLAAAFVIVPALLPIVLNFGLKQLERRGRILRRAKTAWDEFFLRRQSCWIIVHLKDGRRMGGYFGERSFAGLYPNSGHLYVQELWKLGPDGEFETKIQRSEGIVLRPDDYQMIEVFSEA
jgi:Family of unknown function (DUF6338)